MALPLKRTLGELRQELRDRLGFASTGGRSGANTSIIDSFLRNAQTQLYYQFDWKFLISVDKSIVTNKSQTLYDWPDAVDPDRLIQVLAEDTSSSLPNIYPLVEGIDWNHDNYTTTENKPSRYEIRNQIEIWPAPDSASYKIWLEYVQRLGRFTQDADRASIDGDLILLHAISNAKSHYGHRDSQVYVQQLNALLQRLKSGGLGSKRYSRLNSGSSISHDREYSEFTRHVHVDDI
jgi:hypothetical protein